MKKFYEQVVNHSKLIMMVFVIAAIVSTIAKGFVSVNYDMTDYLPDDAKSTTSMDVMNEEFTGGIPNARVMIKDVDIPEALEYKEKLKECTGVEDVLWLDDSLDIHEPLEMQDTDTVENYYKDNTALFTVTIAEDSRIEAVSEIRELIGDDNAMSGDAVSNAIATTSTVDEIKIIATFAIIVVFLMLVLTTTEWITPFIVIAGLGVAILLNEGTNLIFGEISFVTNAAGSVLQLAVSLDYSIFLIHRFEESRKQILNPKEAMVDALCKSTTSILSSGLTTIIGFLALLFMRFKIGSDLGCALAKGVVISLLTVFLFMPGVILACNKWIEKTHHKPLLPSFTKFGNFVSKTMIPMVIVFVILIVPSYLASNSNSFSYGASQIFGTETQCGSDIEAIEDMFGQQDTYVVLVPKGDTAKEVQLSEELHNIAEVKSIISYVDTVGAQIPEEYLEPDTVAKLESENYSRMVLSVETAYEGEETFALVEQIRDTVNEYYPDSYYMAGQGVSTYDLMDSITADMKRVNLIAIGAVFLVLLISMKSISIPFILVLSIETAIWINLSIPYFTDSVIFYMAYLIISSIQLGSTVDYAILLTDRYMELRETRYKMDAVKDTVSGVTVSVLTSGIVLSAAGLLLGKVSTHGILSQLGILLGKGGLLSMIIVLFVLPGLLYLFDNVIQKTTKGIRFMNKTKHDVNEVKSDIDTIEKGKKIQVKNRKKLIAGMLACAIIIGNVSLSASTVSAASLSNSKKEEVVYIMLDANGNTDSVNVVNIFGKGDVSDYGDYSSVKMLTSANPIEQNGDQITFTSNNDKIYYQGTLENVQIPWNIEIKFELDGKTVTAEELAGASGALKIQMKITQNSECENNFFDSYALQTALTLDTNNCKNVVAEGATLANVGSDKQISYIVLPGKELDATITADVTDFEMDAVAINGIKLDLNIEIDDAELMDKVTEIMDASTKLNDGSIELTDGSNRLADGSSDLNEGAESLYNGADSLNQGVATLSTGITAVQEGLNALNSKSASLTDGSGKIMEALKTIQTSLANVSVSTEQLKTLTDSSSGIKQGISDLYDGAVTLQTNLSYEKYKAAMNANGLNIDTLMAGNAEAISSLSGQIADLQGKIEQLKAIPDYESNAEYVTQVTQLEAQVSSLSNVVTLLTGNNAAIGGTETYLNTVSTGVDTLVSNLATLKTNYETFDAAIVSLSQQLSGLAVNMSTLKTGIDTLVTNYGALDSGIEEYTEGVATIVANYSKLVEGVGTLATGSKELLEGAGTLKTGTADLYDGVISLCDGVETMSDGTSEFYDKTAEMDVQVQDQIDEMIASISGDQTETVSFVSEKNTNVDSVQFVIKTTSIEKAEVQAQEEQSSTKMNFWQKLLSLFGLY